MTVSEAIAQRREDILRIARAHGAHNVRLFGSVARGEDDPDSDVDVLVDMDPDRSLLDRAALQVALEDLLGRRVDVATVPSLKERIRERVLRQAVPI
jgi:predicted nucleotidyltransferase